MAIQQKSEVRVAIVSRQNVFGESLAFALDDDDRISIDAVVDHWDHSGLRSRRILVVVLDVEGLEGSIDLAVSHLRTQTPRAAIIVLSSRAQTSVLRQSIESGADGHVSKEKGLAELRRAIHCVASGASYLDAIQTPSVAPGLVAEKVANVRLSPREREVLNLLTQGHSNREIATHLNVAHKTVKNHVSNILSKMDTTSRTQAVIQALRTGVI